MSQTTQTVEVTISKAKVGPLTAHYRGGEFRDITQSENEPKKVAVCSLDNSHSGDYKVAYTSDPLIVVQGRDGISHGRLKIVLKENKLWKDEFIPIQIPYGSGGRVGFKSLPRSSGEIELLRKQAKNNVERDLDILHGENGFTAFLSE